MKMTMMTIDTNNKCLRYDPLSSIVRSHYMVVSSHCDARMSGICSHSAASPFLSSGHPVEVLDSCQLGTCSSDTCPQWTTMSINSSFSTRCHQTWLAGKYPN